MNTGRLREVLLAISKGEIMRKAAAKRLGVSERQVNRLMRAHGVARPASDAHERRLTARMRREAKERAAKAVALGVHSIENAAMQAGCSVRTMFRWVVKLQKNTKNGR